jgi:hypothetical protein
MIEKIMSRIREMKERQRKAELRHRVEDFMQDVPWPVKARAFGRIIKDRYPSYRRLTNRRLAAAFVQAFPEYAYRIKF